MHELVKIVVAGVVVALGLGAVGATVPLEEGGDLTAAVKAAAVTETTCFVGGDPLFKNQARGDYRIKSGSPAQNAGTNQDWMVGAVDLEGNPRQKGRRVDIGCYECQLAGFALIVR